jgi:hypothetical protein
MFFRFEGCAELVLLTLWCEFTSLLFVDESLVFLVTSVTSELDVINCSLSSIQEQPWMKFFVRNVQPSRGSGIPGA